MTLCIQCVHQVLGTFVCLLIGAGQGVHTGSIRAVAAKQKHCLLLLKTSLITAVRGNKTVKMWTESKNVILGPTSQVVW